MSNCALTKIDKARKQTRSLCSLTAVECWQGQGLGGSGEDFLLPQPWVGDPQGCLREDPNGLPLQVFPSSLSLPTSLLYTNSFQSHHLHLALQWPARYNLDYSLDHATHSLPVLTGWWSLTFQLMISVRGIPSDTATQPEKVLITKNRNCSHTPNLEMTATISKIHTTISGLGFVLPRTFMVQKLTERAARFWGWTSDDLSWKDVWVPSCTKPQAPLMLSLSSKRTQNLSSSSH